MPDVATTRDKQRHLSGILHLLHVTVPLSHWSDHQCDAVKVLRDHAGYEYGAELVSRALEYVDNRLSTHQDVLAPVLAWVDQERNEFHRERRRAARGEFILNSIEAITAFDADRPVTLHEHDEGYVNLHESAALRMETLARRPCPVSGDIDDIDIAREWAEFIAAAAHGFGTELTQYAS